MLLTQPKIHSIILRLVWDMPQPSLAAVASAMIEVRRLPVLVGYHPQKSVAMVAHRLPCNSLDGVPEMPKQFGCHDGRLFLGNEVATVLYRAAGHMVRNLTDRRYHVYDGPLVGPER